MLKQLINFYKVSSPRPCNGEALSSSGSQHLHSDARRLKYLKWSTFLSATFGYGMYYVCRLSLNVVKKPIVDEGIFSETELGIIGSVLFFTYALGKFTNGFLADRSNINRFMTTGLLVTALVNLCLGFTHSFILFALLWGIRRKKNGASTFVYRPKHRITVKAKVLFLNQCYITYVFSWIIC